MNVDKKIHKREEIVCLSENFIYKDKKLNNFNINPKKLHQLENYCKSVITDFEKKGIINLDKYHYLKSQTRDFILYYFHYLKKKEEEQEKLKIANLNTPFINLINQYITLGYKIPNLSTKDNLFKNSILIETPNKLNQFFDINKLTIKEFKDLNYLKKLEFYLYVIQEIIKKEKIRDDSVILTNKKKNIKEIFDKINYCTPNIIKDKTGKLKFTHNKNNKIKEIDRYLNITNEDNFKKRDSKTFKTHKILNTLSTAEEFVGHENNKLSNKINRSNKSLFKISKVKKNIELNLDDISVNNNNNNYSSHKSLETNNYSNYNLTEEKIREENKILKLYNDSIKKCIKNLETEKNFYVSKTKFILPSTTKNSAKKKNNYKKIILNSSNFNNKSNLNNSNNLLRPSKTTKNKDKKIINFLLPNNKLNDSNNNNNNIIKSFNNYIKNIKERVSIIKKRRKTYSNLSSNIINTTITEKRKKTITDSYLNELINPNKGDLNDFLRVITKTKNKIQNYNFDNFKKMVYSRNLNENSKMKIISNVENLDKKILDLDKQLIKVVEKNKI